MGRIFQLKALEKMTRGREEILDAGCGIAMLAEPLAETALIFECA